MQGEADLVGDGRTAVGAVGGKLALVDLVQVLGLAAGAFDHVVEVLGRATVENGDDDAVGEAIAVASMRAQTRLSCLQEFAL
ncbi:hypothetical protein X768_22825 [Mesorhizobium sp. LSJC265A00]|nr:hypothetical protein X768_22825 [Mesorhizobium sp. LSJC265A00]